MSVKCRKETRVVRGEEEDRDKIIEVGRGQIV